jgi:hypothetical protein
MALDDAVHRALHLHGALMERGMLATCLMFAEL